MYQTTISTKYQVVIPKEVRGKIQIKPGGILNVNISGEEIILSLAKHPAKLNWPNDYIRDLKNPWNRGNATTYLEKERSSWD